MSAPPAVPDLDPPPLMTGATAGPGVPWRPPRVLLVLRRARGVGGLQLQAVRVALAMRRRGIPVTLLTDAREPVRRGPAWSRYLPTRHLRASDQRSFATELVRYLVRHREAYDVVHVQGLNLELFAALAARRRTGTPVVGHPGGTGKGSLLHLCARGVPALPLVAPGLFRQVDGWVCLSEEIRADLLRLGVAPERAVRLPGGVDCDVFRPIGPDRRLALRGELGLALEDVVLCTSCRLIPLKRVDLLIRLFLGLAPRFPRARLWIMGKGDLLPSLQELAAASPEGDRVRFWGGVPPSRLVRFLQAADLFALLSLREGMPNALLEAMACGLPPVVTAVSGSSEVVADGESGLVVPIHDEEATGRALAALLSDAAERSRLGSAAIHTVREGYSLESVVDRWLEVYASCGKGRRQPPVI